MVEMVAAVALVVFVVGPMLLALGATLYDYLVAPLLIGAGEIDRVAFATLAAAEPARDIIARRLDEASLRSDGRALGQWLRVKKALGRLVD